MKIANNSRFVNRFIFTNILILSVLYVNAQAFDADVPTGFAVVAGDGLQTTTGGANGQVVTASTYAELSSYSSNTNPLIILVEGNISGSGSISVKSNKTIIGKGKTAQLTGFGLDMNTVSNIIIRNLKITGSVDGIAARATHHLWIDHCEIWDCSDGLLDITVASSYCTVSWCRFYYVNQVDHRFACLIGNGGGTAPGDWGRNKVTYHHNWYGVKADQRMPRLMYGQGHIFNDYYTCNGNSYCIGVGSYAAALIENNYFKAVKNPHQFMYDIFCHISANGNYYDNVTGATNTGLGGTRKETGQDFDVKPFTETPYLYWMDDVIDVPSVVSAGASPNTEFGGIGIVPTPGQGAVDVKINAELSWKNGTGVAPLSYLVYFGNTPTPPQVAAITTQSYSSGLLNYGTVYYWRVDVITASGTVEGKLWTFKTEEIQQNIPVTGVTVTPETASIGIGTTTTLKAGVLPSNATNQSVLWSSANNDVATVSTTGLVTGTGYGSTIITATTADGEKTAGCTIQVVENPQEIPLVRINFNEGTGTNVASTGSVSSALVKTDIPEWSSNVPVNGGAGSVDFGASNGNYSVESEVVINELGGLTDFTITGWVNCRSSAVGSGGNRIVSWINNGAHGVDVVFAADGSLKVGINQWPDNSTAISSAGKITTNPAAPAENWKFFAVTYRSSDGQLQFYFGDNTGPAALDKSLIYNKGIVGANIGNLSIGHFNTQSLRASRTDRMFKGLIDEVEIYNSVLPLSQIQLIQQNLIQDINFTVLDNIVELFPNPAKDIINIKYSGIMKGDHKLELIDLTGKKIKQITINDQHCSINISDLKTGTFLLKISGSDVNVVKRIVKL